MKNASRLLYIVSALFAGAFVLESVSFLMRYDETFSAPRHVYLLTYALIYLIPCAVSFLLARLLARKAGGEEGMKKVRFKRPGKKYFR